MQSVNKKVEENAYNKYEIKLHITKLNLHISMVKKHQNILTSVAHTMTKNAFYFGGIGQVTDTITRF